MIDSWVNDHKSRMSSRIGALQYIPFTIGLKSIYKLLLKIHMRNFV